MRSLKNPYNLSGRALRKGYVIESLSISYDEFLKALEIYECILLYLWVKSVSELYRYPLLIEREEYSFCDGENA